MPRCLTVLICLTLAPLTAGLAGAEPANLLTNPGFEDPAGWLHGWSVERVNPQGPLYHYHLRDTGGGHANARPHTGAHALEIYSNNTRLAQTVKVEPGRYLLTVWTRNNGCSIDPKLILSLGAQRRTVSVLSDRYRRVYAAFEVKEAGDAAIGLISPTLGLAVDDVALTRLGPDDPLPAEFMYIDLLPSGDERSENIQTYFKGMKQWVNFSVTTLDDRRMKLPEMTITVPAAVKLTGLNEGLINGYKPFSLKEDVKIAVSTGQDAAGAPVTLYRFPCPRFVGGPENPTSFGGCFVEVPAGTESWVKMSLADGGVPITEETFKLIPLNLPTAQRTPRLLKTLSYGVQDWKQDVQGRLDTTPRLFKLMGLNVWSDYRGPGQKGERPADGEQQVAAKAAREYGVKEFWPNYSQLLAGASPEGCWYWGSEKRATDDPDMYIVRADGSVDKDHFNMRYAAGKGRYFVEVVLDALQRMMRQPAELKLPYNYSGFITDALEGIYVSYDATTLADFARQYNLDLAQVTPASVNGQYQKEWTSYNNKLYAEVAARLAEALREVNPQIKMLNTAGPFGAQHGAEDLPLAERQLWARAYDYSMPQWYSLHYFGSLYTDTIMQGVHANVFGRAQGYADLIPLLCNSMGATREDLDCIRFKVIDLLSTAPVVKGIGYYIGTNAFADPRWIVGISRVHTLVADVEDYFVSGMRQDNLVKFTPRPGGIKPIEGRDEEGNQTTLVPKVETAQRVFVLGRQGRRALVVLVSHCNQGVGEAGTLTLDLKSLGATPRSFVYDHITGQKLPLKPEMTVDTNATGSLSVLEITEVMPAAGGR